MKATLLLGPSGPGLSGDEKIPPFGSETCPSRGMNYLNFKRPLQVTAEDAAFLKEMETTSKRVARLYVEGTEKAIGERLKALLGRIPSADEVRQHGFCGIWPDGSREYKWKGETILKIAPIFTGIRPPDR